MVFTKIWKQLPALDSKFGMAILMSHSIVALLCIAVLLFFKSGRKRLKKYWRLSQQGPFYRLGAFVCQTIFSAFVKISRPFLAKKMVPDPKQLSPRFTTIKTQSDRIILNWQVNGPQSAWSLDQYELQVCKVFPHAGQKAADVLEWETLQLDKKLAYDYKGLEPGKAMKFRVRVVNQKGSSDWCSGEFSTRQIPKEFGGSGPGYTWKQSSKHVQALIACRPDTRAKDIAVECKGGRLNVEDRGKSPTTLLVDGILTAAVKGSELAWTLGDDEQGGRRVVVTIEKVEHTQARKDHWLALLQGHPFVDRRFLPEGPINAKLEG